MTPTPYIAAIHATSASIPPLRSALAEKMPDAQMWNLVDDRLGPDADALHGDLTPRLRDRMLNLVRHAIEHGADAVLIACSMYGDVRHVAEMLFDIPVFASDTDMLADIVHAAPKRVAVLASLQGAAADTTARLTAALSAAGVPAQVVPVYCDGAADAAARGDIPALAAELSRGLAAAPGEFDLICIAQYSLSPAADELAVGVAAPVMAPTQAAARAIARRLSAS